MKNKYPFLLMSLFLLLMMTGCENFKKVNNPPQASQGVIDLNHWDFYNDGVISLDGDWSFYWQQLLIPDDLKQVHTNPPTLNVPSYWSDQEIQDIQLSHTGYGTYHLRTYLPKEAIGQRLAFYMPVTMTSYQLWIDGELVSQNGKTGTTKQETEPKYIPTIIPHQPRHQEIDIVLQVSNFHHRDGGTWDSLKLGTYSNIKNIQLSNIVTELILIGALLIAAGYHLSLNLFRRKNKINLYFGTLCLLIAIRIPVTGEMLLYQYFPKLSWSVGLKLEYLAFYLCVGILILYVQSMFPSESNKKTVKTYVWISSIFSCFVLLTPPYLFTQSAIIYQLFTLIVVGYCMLIFIRAAHNKQEGAKLTIILFIFFSLTIINDILHNKQIISSFNMAPLGILFLILGQSVILSIRLSKAFNKVEELSAQQQKWQQELENKVIERTKDLETTLQRLTETQSQLVEGEKMRSLGNLVAGVAHEINTPLGISVTATSHLEGKTKEIINILNQNQMKKSDLLKYLNSADEALSIIQPNLYRASELIRSFKQVAVDQSSDYERSVNVRDYIDEIINSLKPNIKKVNAIVELTCDENITLHCNPGNLSQIFTNLIMNSINHAFEKQHLNQEIKINITSDDQFIVFRYSDNGKGMDETTKSQIFEPFFTTKRGQGGSGLGMHIVYNIINQSLQGKIECHSDLHVGTTFIITLPVNR